MSKIKTRLPDYIAEELGFEDLNNSKQYRITPEQHKEVKDLRKNILKLQPEIAKKNRTILQK